MLEPDPASKSLNLTYSKEIAYGLKKILTEIALRGSSNHVGALVDFFLQKPVKFVMK